MRSNHSDLVCHLLPVLINFCHLCFKTFIFLYEEIQNSFSECLDWNDSMNLTFKGHWAITLTDSYIFTEKKTILLNEWRSNLFLSCVNSTRSMASAPSILAFNIIFGIRLPKFVLWFSYWTLFCLVLKLIRGIYEIFGEFSVLKNTSNWTI